MATIMMLFLLLGVTNVGVARRVKKAAAAAAETRALESTSEAQHEALTAETQEPQEWTYENASTAWEVLCHSRQAGVFGAKWTEKAWVGRQSLTWKCDPDEREEGIKITWSGWTGKDIIIRKDATVLSSGGFSFRFFLESEGCDSTDMCELPWARFDTFRRSLLKQNIVNRFLIYDASKVGARVVTIETNKYYAWFYQSEILETGVGLPLPSEPVFAGDGGTGCGEGITGCSEPGSAEQPRGGITQLDVTMKYLIKCPSNPSHECLMTNRNWAKIHKTERTQFKWAAQ